MRVDARGLGCPQPVLMAEEALTKMNEGIIEVSVDNEGAAENLASYARNNGFSSETMKDGPFWIVKIVKGYVCGTVQGQETEKEMLKDLMLIIGSDSLGKEEELGRMLVKGFFDTMKVTREVPHTIFFLNAGVRLTTINEEVVPVLKELEAMGVEIFSCGTCLKYYGLEDMLRVGYRGTTNHIVEGLKDFRQVVWI